MSQNQPTLINVTLMINIILFVLLQRCEMKVIINCYIYYGNVDRD